MGVELDQLDGWQYNETIILDAAFRNWLKFEPVLTKITRAPVITGVPITDVILQAPLKNPGTIYCAGANYYDHAREMGVSINKDSIEPIFFSSRVDPLLVIIKILNYQKIIQRSMTGKLNLRQLLEKKATT